MANFASEAVGFISHQVPEEQDLERYFATVPERTEEGDEKDDYFDFAVPLEDEHLEALASYEAMLQEEMNRPKDTPTMVYDFLHEKGEQEYPFAFWYECCSLTPEADFSLAYILIMMSNHAVSPHESIHALFTATVEAINGILEFEEEAAQLVSAAIDISRDKLVGYVPSGHQTIAEALWCNYIETIERGDELMDRHLCAIEDVYFKMISSH